MLNAIDKSLAERDQNLDKFCTHLDKDIQVLNKEVKEVKRESQNPIILDINADHDAIRQTLDRMQERMDEFQKKAFLYKSYQKNFKVEVTKYEELEEVHAELKLKQLLWDSIDEWDKLIQEWSGVSWPLVSQAESFDFLKLVQPRFTSFAESLTHELHVHFNVSGGVRYSGP